MTRGAVVSGNWKMHLGPEETRAFFRAFAPRLPAEGGPTVLIFPPALSLSAAMESRPEDPPVLLGVQNIHWEREGAFTGEVSAAMARASGATHVLVGHSERRHVFGETDEQVARKVRAALSEGLTPVVCVGETLTERQEGRLEAVILAQLEAFLPFVMGGDETPFLLAYEPVWAIGTGETATPEDADEAHGLLRERMRKELGQERSAEVSILYGGSVKPGNARELLDVPEVDGVLVGGASLDPASFAAIVEASAGGSG